MSKQDYLSRAIAPKVKATPQTTKAVKGQKKNNAGGFVFKIDKWSRLRRFLILGTEVNTYYQTEQKLTRQNVANLTRCIIDDGRRTVDEIVAISVEGRAPKQEPTMLALAMCAAADDVKTRQYALSKVPEVCRIGTHLFMFVNYVRQLRGWGRGLQTAIANWYTAKEPEQLAYQLAKYKQRDGISHRDVLRLAKPVPYGSTSAHFTAEIDANLAWAVGKEKSGKSAFLGAVDEAKTAKTKRLIELIEEHRLPFECVPSDKLKDADVLRAMIPGMGYTQLMRYLNRLTAYDVLTGTTLAEVAGRLVDGKAIERGRVHPLAILTAQRTYIRGRGDKGSLLWHPKPKITDALNDAFYLSFKTIESSGQRYLIGLDVSGSMDMGTIAGSPLTPREASAAMALATIASEDDVHTVAFTGAFTGTGRRNCVKPLHISARQRLNDVIRYVSDMTFGLTDCALPMLYAIEHKLDVDAFVVYTDNESYAGDVHPFQALERYRQQSGIDAKLVVVAMTATRFNVANPDDPGMLDVVGFDSAAPRIIADFASGRI